MIVEINQVVFKRLAVKNIKDTILNHNKALVKTVHKLNGRIVKQEHNRFLISFDSVTNAILCAVEIQTICKRRYAGSANKPLILNIGLSAGIPVTDKEGIFEDTIKLAERLCNVANGKIAISSQVKDLYESENQNVSIQNEIINTIDANDEKFLHALMDFIEQEWQNPALSSDDFCKSLGYSKSQLNRKLNSLTGTSSKNFLQEYRLNRALLLLNKKLTYISEIAFETGFNSPAYFSKCFKDKYGVLPSKISSLVSN